MSSLHHSFDINLAEIYGIKEAIIIHHFQHWIAVNKRLNRNFHEGRTWSYQTFEQIAAHFPYFTKEEVREILYKLCTGKSRKSKKEKYFEPVLKKGNFNKTKFDRTTWYAFENEKIFTMRGSPQMGAGESPNEKREMPKPIPDTKKTSTKETNIKEERGETPQTPTPSSTLLIQRLEHVKTTDEEHRKLVEEFGEQKTQACYQRLNEWKLDTPRSKWKKSDYRSILRWVVNAVDEQSKRNPSGNDRTFAQEIKRKHETGTFTIDVNENEIEFRDSKVNAVKVFAYGKDFKERVTDFLKKIGA